MKKELNIAAILMEKPKQEFKDGDIVTFKKDGKPNITIILKRADFDYIDQLPRVHYHAMYDYETNKLRKELGYIKKDIRYYGCLTMEGNEFILATDSEKQKLFDALAKEGKVWNPDTKQIEDLPKKCEFKPLDLCLMRNYPYRWELCQYAYQDDFGEYCYHTLNGIVFHNCIPYNDSTKHLLGTSDEWKGGK